MDATLVGGLFGLGGVLVGGLIGPVGSWVLEERKEKADKRRKRAEKLEELVSGLFAHRHWLEQTRNLRVFGDTDPTEPSPFSKVEAIATVYFPVFLPSLAELSTAVSAYEIWMMEARMKRLDTGKTSTEGVALVFRPYLEKLGKLLGEIREYAKTEFQ